MNSFLLLLLLAVAGQTTQVNAQDESVVKRLSNLSSPSRDTVQSIEQYINWKTKRRHFYTSRHLKIVGDDDELFFDSNGMPIRHDDDDDIGEIQDAGAPTHGTAGNKQIPKQTVHKSKNQDNLNEDIQSDQDTTATYKLFNNTQHHQEEKQADTILDDILRGFSFASLFCICVLILHKLCWYSCIRCGILPDDRLVEARWKRYQLMRKRAYAVPESMDAKSLGRWFDQRDRMHPDGLGIWDSSAERSVGSWDEESSGAIDFDEGIQLSNWDGDNASTANELEYGEGEELEDKSHDERLFDLEDGGAGLKMQANKFFNGSKKLFGKKSTRQKEKATTNTYAPIQKQADNDVTDDAFFDAFQSPLGSKGSCSDHASESSKSRADFLQQQDNSQTSNSNQRDDADLNDEMLLEDRGYDEESDLLGLRSDSPPPLDLAEIEKDMLENMENAKSYY